MSPAAPNRDPNPGRHKLALVLLTGGVTLLFLAVFAQTAFNLNPFLRPRTSQETLIYAAVSALVFLLLVVLTFVLVRNLAKLWAERRMGVLGSKFRTRMVIWALILTFTPAIFLFLFAYGLMNRSIDKWFSDPVSRLSEDTQQLATLLSRYAAHNARSEAAAIAAAPVTQQAFASGDYREVAAEFRSRERTLQGGFAVAVLEEDAVAALHIPKAWTFLRTELPPPATIAKEPLKILELEDKHYVLGSAPAGPGWIVVAMPLPADFTSVLNRVEESRQLYAELSRENKQLRRTYMGLLWLLTMLVLFLATWFALLVSKLVTRPVMALAEAMDEVSQGRLDKRVQVPAADEIADLVNAFNRMAEEMETSRKQIEASSRELSNKNLELDQRRQQMETVLESIPTGVLSLDASLRVTHSNAAFERGFRPEAGKPAAGQPLAAMFNREVVTDLEHLLRKADRMGTATGQMEMTVSGSKRDVAVTVASLRHEQEHMGYVVVLEDLSDLIKAQKQAAWREVAQRVAHEIKNPLTPIALSAERIRRHLERGLQPDETSVKALQSCAKTIATSVETVRTLVDEFSTLARFPAAQPRPADVNVIVESALAMFDGRLAGIEVRTFLSSELPPVMADPDALKRAVANLVDNAAEATQACLVREIHISTGLTAGREAVEIVVADSGHGVTPEVKEKLFFPYFSTKKRGTGLGLAIVSRIVEDHHGSIRVEENRPVGARFIVEIPVANGSGVDLLKVHHA